jgi:hypothetical protein
MPSWDKANLGVVDDLIVSTVNSSLTARMIHPWAASIPRDAFNNFVLPYASVNEGRSSWRTLFAPTLQPLLSNTPTTATLAEVATTINDGMWTALSLHSKAIVFKSEQTPAIFDPMSTIVFGFASCTGISIMYVDALRSVGIPARLVGTPAWNGNTTHGNHNWVEVMTSAVPSTWSFVEGRPAGGGESFTNPCDKWYCSKGKFPAASAGSPDQTLVYAAQFEPNGGVVYPLAWDPANTEIPGVDRTDYYMQTCSKC